MQREEFGAPRGGPSFALAAALTAVVVLGDAVTLFVFGLACGIGDTSATPWRTFCDAELNVAPAIGGAATFVGAVVSQGWRRWWPLVVGSTLGIVAAVLPWLLLGDPAGNFGGVLTFVGAGPPQP